MTGSEIVRTIEDCLSKKGISKSEFYKDCNMTSATLSNWRSNVFTPSQQKLRTIASYLGIAYEELIGADDQDDTAELREAIRSRTDLRLLFNSAKDAPPSQIYALLSQLEKLKEGNN